MKTGVSFDFCLQIWIGSILDQIKHYLFVAEDHGHVKWRHAILVCFNEKLFLK